MNKLGVGAGHPDCTVCPRVKLARSPIPRVRESTATLAREKLDKVHSDLMTLSVWSLGGAKYAVIFLDEVTRFGGASEVLGPLVLALISRNIREQCLTFSGISCYLCHQLDLYMFGLNFFITGLVHTNLDDELEHQDNSHGNLLDLPLRALHNAESLVKRHRTRGC